MDSFLLKLTGFVRKVKESLGNKSARSDPKARQLLLKQAMTVVQQIINKFDKNRLVLLLLNLDEKDHKNMNNKSVVLHCLSMFLSEMPDGQSLLQIRDAFKMFNFLLHCLEQDGETELQEMVKEIFQVFETKVFNNDRKAVLDYLGRVMFTEKFVKLVQHVYPDHKFEVVLPDPDDLPDNYTRPSPSKADKTKLKRPPVFPKKKPKLQSDAETEHKEEEHHTKTESVTETPKKLNPALEA